MNNISTNFKTLYSFTTELNADSVEWCPHEPNQNVFVCANYQLNEQNLVKISQSVHKSNDFISFLGCTLYTFRKDITVFFLT